MKLEEVAVLQQERNGLTAAAGPPLVPQRAWFEMEEPEEPTGWTVTADGQVYGHAALWNSCHTGKPGRCVTPPKSRSGYAFYRTGLTEVDDGELIPTGRITLGTGHASLTASPAATAEHYDNTGAVVADVVVKDGKHGIWVTGALRPDVSPERIRTLRGASLSGDWRSIRGALELLGMLAVNVPGFPVPRAQALTADARRDVYAEALEENEEILALVAAGTFAAVDMPSAEQLAPKEPTEAEWENAIAELTAAATKPSSRQEKVAKVMKEFKAGTLKSSTGQVVKSRKQAIAIALSEARMTASAEELAEIAETAGAVWDTAQSRVAATYDEENPSEEAAPGEESDYAENWDEDMMRSALARASAGEDPAVIADEYDIPEDEFGYTALQRARDGEDVGVLLDECARHYEEAEPEEPEPDQDEDDLGELNAAAEEDCVECEQEARAFDPWELPARRTQYTELLGAELRAAGDPEEAAAAEWWHAWEYGVEDALTAAGPRQAQRDAWEKKGWTLPGGRYPIPNRAFLKKAIGALGRASQHDDYDKVKSWIIKRARALKAVDLLPAAWEITASAWLTGGTWDESKHPRYDKGRAEGGQFAPKGTSKLAPRPDEVGPRSAKDYPMSLEGNDQLMQRRREIDRQLRKAGPQENARNYDRLMAERKAIEKELANKERSPAALDRSQGGKLIRGPGGKLMSRTEAGKLLDKQEGRATREHMMTPSELPDEDAEHFIDFQNEGAISQNGVTYYPDMSPGDWEAEMKRPNGTLVLTDESGEQKFMKPAEYAKHKAGSSPLPGRGSSATPADLNYAEGAPPEKAGPKTKIQFAAAQARLGESARTLQARFDLSMEDATKAWELARERHIKEGKLVDLSDQYHI